MNNTIKFKSKNYGMNITAKLGEYNIIFEIEEKPGIKRCVDILFPADDYDITVLMDELNRALPDNIAVGIKNDLPVYYVRK
jgi:hypothetical protein